MKIINTISSLVIPTTIFIIIVFGLSETKINIYQCFIEGAKEGIDSTIKILPPLIALLMAITIIRESGAVEIIGHGLKPLISIIKMPIEILPLAIIRPISGSAALATVMDIINKFGPDTLIGRIASVMMGSTETTFYTVAIYFGSVGIRNSRHTIKSALLADITGILFSIWICRLMFKL